MLSRAPGVAELSLGSEGAESSSEGVRGRPRQPHHQSIALPCTHSRAVGTGTLHAHLWLASDHLHIPDPCLTIK